MSEPYDDESEDERTSPSIVLPDAVPDELATQESTAQTELAEAALERAAKRASGDGSTPPPSKRPPPLSSRPSAPSSDKEAPASAWPADPLIKPLEPQDTRISASPLGPAGGSERPPPDSHRLTQLEGQLEKVKSLLARQGHEVHELRARLAVREQRLEDIVAKAPLLGSPEVLERLSAVEAALAERHQTESRSVPAQAAPGVGDEALAALEARLERLEEGTEASRIRMRLERAGHRLDAVDERVEHLASAQDRLGELLSSARATNQRVERLESLFDEVAQELRELRDVRGDDELRARLADLETLVLEAGTNERHLRERVEAQTDELRKLSESIAPGARPQDASDDDLTRIKGVGPKYARGLAGMGVTSIAQVAAWGDDEVQRAATTLGLKPSRVRRWVDAAKKT